MFGSFIPGRNVAGNTPEETELAACTLGDKTKIRHNETQETEASRYSVTSDSVGIGRERQVLFCYEKPRLLNLECGPDHVTLTGEAFRVGWTRKICDLRAVPSNAL